MQAKARKPHSVQRSPDDLIIEAATVLFYQSGFRAVSIDEIAARSGFTKTTVYRYFTSKDELAALCLGRLAADHLHGLSLIAERFPNAPLDQLRAIVADAAARMRYPVYRGWPMSNAQVEISDQDHPIRQTCQIYKARFREHLVKTARRADYPAPASLADGLLMLLEGAGASWHTLGHDAAAASLILNGELLLRGHRAAP